ncbi:transposase [Persicitalea jodogahamensis]|uniref:transposase n=1 Tax=Persicitalea jodogahamensis TaxID=402147 RepID=UPI00167561A1|nr:transposase [Persicitalea jodogahamensis]
MEYKPEYRRYLPHFQPAGVAFFITGRLYGSLPQEALERLKEEKEAAYNRIKRECRDEKIREEEIRKMHKRHFARWDEYLDSNSSEPQWLMKPEIASIIIESLHLWNEKSYSLVAYCIMPNHFHMVIDTSDEAKYTKPLYAIMHTLKSYTAKKANKALDRVGTFWQEESYDHVIRDSRELKNTVVYTLENPVKAGLVDAWENFPFSFVNGDYV